MDRLIKENAVSDQQYEQVKLAYDAAKAQLEQAQAGRQPGPARPEHLAVMKAPWAGIIASKNAEVGDVINPMMGGFGAAAGVLTLMDYSRIKIVVDVSAADIARIRKGQPAPSSAVGDRPGREFRGDGHASSTSTADPLTKKFRVEVAVDNPDAVLRPGHVRRPSSSRSSPMRTPWPSPRRPSSRTRTSSSSKAAKPSSSEVTLGLQNTTMIEVLSGLAEGDLVIVEGNFGLTTAPPVEIRRGEAMKLPEFSVNSRVTTTMMAMILVVVGAISFTRLGLDFFPDLEFPTVSVITTYPGRLVRRTSKTSITRPLEQVVSSVNRVKKVTSTTSEGVSVIQVEFEWGTNLDFAAQDLRDQIGLYKQLSARGGRRSPGRQVQLQPDAGHLLRHHRRHAAMPS